MSLAFGEAIGEWEAISKRERTSRRAVTRAHALVAVNDQRLAELTTALGGAVLVEAKQDRKSTFFRRFFLSSPSELIRAALRKQL